MSDFWEQLEANKQKNADFFDQVAGKRKNDATTQAAPATWKKYLLAVIFIDLVIVAVALYWLFVPQETVTNVVLPASPVFSLAVPDTLQTAYPLDGAPVTLRNHSSGATVQISHTNGVTRFYALPPEQAARALAFSPDGKWLAVADSTGQLFLWRVRDISDRLPFDSEPLSLQLTTTHRAPIVALAFSTDSKYLTSSDAQGIALTWEAASGRLVR